MKDLKNAHTSDKASPISIVIGTQIWMTQNLDTDVFRNGDPIPEVKSPDEWNSFCHRKQPAWCYYNNDPELGKTYGKLYNWYAVVDPRGLSPEGWHIPSDEEWAILVELLGGKFWAGGKLKAKEYWLDPNGGASNVCGFSALPGGARYANFSGNEYGDFNRIGEFGFWWTSTERNEKYAFKRYMYFKTSEIFGNDVLKATKGYSVRCIKDIAAKISVNPEIENATDEISLSKKKPLSKRIWFKKPYLGGSENSASIEIVNQIWMNRNLHIDWFRNGDLIPNAPSDEEWQQYEIEKKPCWCYYDNDPKIGRVFGKLYNGYALSDPRGLAPVGWHIPSEEEWRNLVFALGGKISYSRHMICNQLMSSKYSSNPNQIKTNSPGFEALPGGYREINGKFFNLEKSGYFWGYWKKIGHKPWIINESFRGINPYYGSGHMFVKSFEPGCGMSVRCIKD